jgi:hypothetical protein
VVEKNLSVRCGIAVIILIVTSGAISLAQSVGSISGRIEDESGAAIPTATVTVTSLETGLSRTVSTDGTGTYRVLSLPVGQYQVRAEKEGFRATVQSGLNLKPVWGEDRRVCGEV